jgi:uncharacterized protein YegP (UPF0339 family)
MKIHKTKNKQFYFTTSGNNGKQLASSQKSYNRNENAEKGLAALIRKARNPATLITLLDGTTVTVSQLLAKHPERKR